MAEAYGDGDRPAGVCLSTLGPGSTALVNGVAAANLDRVPMLAISGQIETAPRAGLHPPGGRSQADVLPGHQVGRPDRGRFGRDDHAQGATDRDRRTSGRGTPDRRRRRVHGRGGRPRGGAAPADTRRPSTIVYARGRAPRPDPARSPRPGARCCWPASAATRRGATDALVRLAETRRRAGRGLADGQGRVPGGTSAVRRRARHGLQPGRLAVPRRSRPDRDRRLRSGRADQAVVARHAGTARRHDCRTPTRSMPATSRCVGDVGAVLDELAASLARRAALVRGRRSPPPRPAPRRLLRGPVDGRLNPTDVVDVVRAASPRDTHRQQRRRLAQAAGRPGLAAYDPAQRADDQRPVLDGASAFLPRSRRSWPGPTVPWSRWSATADSRWPPPRCGWPRASGWAIVFVVFVRRQPEPDRAQADAAGAIRARRPGSSRHRPVGLAEAMDCDGVARRVQPPSWRRRWPGSRSLPGRWSSRPHRPGPVRIPVLRRRVIRAGARRRPLVAAADQDGCRDDQRGGPRRGRLVRGRPYAGGAAAGASAGEPPCAMTSASSAAGSSRTVPA